jgi:branched-chain amino acid transport system ATP-binding protein
MLDVQSIQVKYGAAQVVFNVSLMIGRGEVVALLGRNGAGKSTTLKAAMGLLPISAGRVRFDDQEITGRPSFEIARMGLGYVPEDRRMFGGLTVAENLDMGRRPARPGIEPWTFERLVELFPNLGTIRHRKAAHISGGEQQMVTIGRTLMGQPRAILLDEPSEGLAPKIVEQMIGAILKIKADGISIVLSEQNMHFASLISDRAYVIEKGNIRYSGTMSALKADEEISRTYLAL